MVVVEGWCSLFFGSAGFEKSLPLRGVNCSGHSEWGFFLVTNEERSTFPLVPQCVLWAHLVYDDDDDDEVSSRVCGCWSPVSVSQVSKVFLLDRFQCLGSRLVNKFRVTFGREVKFGLFSSNFKFSSFGLFSSEPISELGRYPIARFSAQSG